MDFLILFHTAETEERKKLNGNCHNYISSSLSDIHIGDWCGRVRWKELVGRAVAYCGYFPFFARKRCYAVDYRKQCHPLHLAAMPVNLIEFELFEHKKGSCTGAAQDTIGYLEEVSVYGSVFLDEIGEISDEITNKIAKSSAKSHVATSGRDR